METLSETLAGYEPAGEAEESALTQIQSLLREAEPWSRDRPLHLTASALVVDPASARVLLRWHARLGRWLQVGGHGDPGESDPWAIALREAWEETGLTDLREPAPALLRRPVHLAVVAVPARSDEPAHRHADIRYLLATSRPETAVAESPGAPVRWFTIAEALSRAAAGAGAGPAGTDPAGAGADGASPAAVAGGASNRDSSFEELLRRAARALSLT